MAKYRLYVDEVGNPELKIKPKTANITGLQLADLLAHPARGWFYKNILEMDDGKMTF